MRREEEEEEEGFDPLDALVPVLYLPAIGIFYLREALLRNRLIGTDEFRSRVLESIGSMGYGFVDPGGVIDRLASEQRFEECAMLRESGDVCRHVCSLLLREECSGVPEIFRVLEAHTVDLDEDED